MNNNEVRQAKTVYGKIQKIEQRLAVLNKAVSSAKHAMERDGDGSSRVRDVQVKNKYILSMFYSERKFLVSRLSKLEGEFSRI